MEFSHSEENNKTIFIYGIFCVITFQAHGALAGNRLKCWTLWLGCMVHHPYVWENPRLAKLGANLGQSSQPIRLQQKTLWW